MTESACLLVHIFKNCILDSSEVLLAPRKMPPSPHWTLPPAFPKEHALFQTLDAPFTRVEHLPGPCTCAVERAMAWECPKAVLASRQQARPHPARPSVPSPQLFKEGGLSLGAHPEQLPLVSVQGPQAGHLLSDRTGSLQKRPCRAFAGSGG